MRITHMIVIVCGSAVLLGVVPSHAQQKCPEGRTADGKCVNAGLALDMRTGTVAFTQPKLSMTNPPVMPYQDGQYYVPRDHHEVSNLHGYPPITNPAGETRTIDLGTGAGPFIDVFIGPRP